MVNYNVVADIFVLLSGTIFLQTVIFVFVNLIQSAVLSVISHSQSQSFSECDWSFAVISLEQGLLKHHPLMEQKLSRKVQLRRKVTVPPS